MPCLEISAPLTLMWLFGRLFMDIIVSVTVLVISYICVKITYDIYMYTFLYICGVLLPSTINQDFCSFQCDTYISTITITFVLIQIQKYQREH